MPYRVFDAKYEYGEPNGNMIIHGDNLSVLKSLLSEYEGKIRCIYIDPSYNTGNEGWVYNDNVNDPRIRKCLGEVVGSDGEDLSRHDKWLCMKTICKGNLEIIKDPRTAGYRGRSKYRRIYPSDSAFSGTTEE